MHKIDRTLPRPRLVDGQCATLLRHILRFQELFDLASARLKPEHFQQGGDLALAMVWSAALTATSHYGNGRLPADPSLAWGMFDNETRSQLASCPGADQEEAVFGPGGFFAWAFAEDVGLDLEYGRKLLVEFLRERTVYDPLRALLNSLEGQVPQRLDQLLGEYQTRDQSLQAIRRRTGRSAAPSGYMPRILDKSSTGVAFLDEVMNGGDAPREVYGILGMYGGGKTALGVQASYSKALIFQARAAVGRPLEHCHYFHYETDYDEMLLRFWGHAAEIHKDELENFAWESLSTRGALKNYEKLRFKKKIHEQGSENVDGELERLVLAQHLLDQNVHLHDFSGGDPENTTAGMNYVDEIAASLRQEAESGQKIGAVYIDYVLAACRRHLNLTGRKTEDLRHLIAAFPDECYRKIAKTFDCRVYLFQQLSGEANKRGFTARLSHADAGECRSFAENLWFCLELGAIHRETGCLWVHCTKTRRAKGLETPPLVRLDGAFGRFSLATDMTISSTLGTPIPKTELSLVGHSHQLEQLTAPSSTKNKISIDEDVV